MTKTISRRTVAKGTAWAAPAIVVATAAPAMAASATPKYRFRASQYYTRGCTFGGRSLTASNQVQVGTSPLGFTVVNDADSKGVASVTTTATIQSLTYVVGFPESYIDAAYKANPFVMRNGTGANWQLQGYTRQLMNGVYYLVYTFNFVGPRSAQTVPDGFSPTPWPGSPFEADLRYSTTVCNGSYQVWGGYNASIATANGQVVTSTLPPRWNTLY